MYTLDEDIASVERKLKVLRFVNACGLEDSITIFRSGLLNGIIYCNIADYIHIGVKEGILDNEQASMLIELINDLLEENALTRDTHIF